MRNIAINSLGEIFLNGSCVGSPISTAAIYIRDKVSALKKDKGAINKAIHEAFDKQIDSTFTLSEALSVKSVMDKQAVNDPRFRIYASTSTVSGKMTAKMVTEFIAFLDDHFAWLKIYTISQNLEADIQVMREGKHIDQSRPADQEHWDYGPNHGHVERQVEFSWDVTDLTIRQINTLIAKAKEATGEIWEAYGVGIL